MSKVVLITGCSTGIGRDAAQCLARSGYTVVATARKLETLQDLSVALKLTLDVTQPDSILRAVDETIRKFGRINILINNAGYALRGVVEEVQVEQAQKMFDANLFGVIRLVQAVAPYMRKQGEGRIINISSIAGKLSTPVNGLYSASKFALEAISDALRWELAPFGVRVVLIEPGSIKTAFEENARASSSTLLINSSSPYHLLYRQSDLVTLDMRKNEPGAEVVSRVIKNAIEVNNPKARYLAGFSFSGRIVLYLRDVLWNLVIQQLFKISSTTKKDINGY
jgi:NAD(P)-dependent dehydrogenase (short-subunit alcohol dehydrogenase family)